MRSSELGAVVARLSELRGSTVDATVALLYDWPSAWALNAPSLPSSLVRASDAPRAYHRTLRALGVTCDIVHPHHDLARYQVVIVPTLYLCDDRAAAAVAAAAADGAHVVVTYFSGIVDEHDHIRLGGYPGAFRDLLGVRAEEFFPLAPDEVVELSDGSRAAVWSERLNVDAETEVVGHPHDSDVGGMAGRSRCVESEPARRGTSPSPSTTSRWLAS